MAVDHQLVAASTARGRVVAVDSAYDVRPVNRDRDVVVNASYCGVLPARFLAEHHPRGVIGVDCGVGPEGSAIAGLWYLEALGIPAAAADVMTVRLGDGMDLHDQGIISFLNQPARDAGVHVGMRVADAALAMLAHDSSAVAAAEVTNRKTMHRAVDGREIVCTDSIAFGTEADRGRNVLVTAGHTGRSAVPYLVRVSPHGFICSDGGGGREGSGTAGLFEVESLGLAGATVDGRTARMGDAVSTWADGIISAVNAPAAAAGLRVGMVCPDAARLLLDRPSVSSLSSPEGSSRVI